MAQCSPSRRRRRHSFSLFPLSASAGCTALFDPSGSGAVTFSADERLGCDALLLTGRPLREPVALGGPIVMNYDWEIDEAYRELQAGTFLKRRKA